MLSAEALPFRLCETTNMATAYEQEKAQYLQYFQSSKDKRTGRPEEMRMSPLISLKVRHTIDKPPSPQPIFPQTRFLGIQIHDHEANVDNEPILQNVDAPNSTFICGSQGSGKSYTLSCMLENCLLKDKRYGVLKTPVAGIVFHYDTDSGNSVAEAASLCSRGIKVRVLVSPANRRQLEKAYKALSGADKHLEIVPLLFTDEHINTARMKRLMAFSEQEGTVPLYMEVIIKILREMEIKGKKFKFPEFRKELNKPQFSPAQGNMMNMRLDLLQSFMDLSETGKKTDIFQLSPGTLTVIDLSDPFMDAATVCVLFDVCLGLIKQNRPNSGLVVALDEAHKYINKTSAAETFTEELRSTIRLQRHNATRVIIATQEPTISETLLDLCSVSIVHRFNSPAWFNAIKDHLGGASSRTSSDKEQNDMFEQILDLNVGESLVFSPSSYVCLQGEEAKKLGSGVITMKTRMRDGVDTGKSVTATG